MKWKNVLKNVIFALMLASSLGFFKWWGTSCRADRDLQRLTGWRVENAPPLFECRVVNPMETFASVFSCPCSDVLPGGKWISLSAKLNLICWFMFYMHIPQNPCFCYNRLTCLLSSKWYFLGKNKRSVPSKSPNRWLGILLHSWKIHVSARGKQIPPGLSNNGQPQLFVQGWEVAAISKIAVFYWVWRRLLYVHLCKW